MNGQERGIPVNGIISGILKCQAGRKKSSSIFFAGFIVFWLELSRPGVRCVSISVEPLFKSH